MDDAYALSAEEVIARLGVDANDGLADEKVIDLRIKHGKNGRTALATLPPRFTPSSSRHGMLTDRCATAIPDEPPTPLWELILEQFKDQLVIILLGSAVVSFVLALFEDEGGWSAFVDPAVVGTTLAPYPERRASNSSFLGRSSPS